MSHPSLQKEREQLAKIEKISREKSEATVIAETLKKLREQIEIFPEFYERLGNIEASHMEIKANQVKLGESLKLIQVTLDVRDVEDREILRYLNEKIKKAK